MSESKPVPVRVQILAARLRVVLDQRLGRSTPKQVRDLAAQTISKAPLQPGWDSK